MTSTVAHNQPNANTERVILRRTAVELRSGLTRSAMYALIKKKQFPEPIKLTARAVGWDSVAVQAWIDSKVAA